MADKAKKSGERANRIIGRRYRYTGDYKVVTALAPGGGYEKRVIYTGDWIRPVIEDEAWRRLVLILRLLTAFSVLAFLGALLILSGPMENKWYVPVLTVAAFPLAYQIFGAVRMPAARTCMERQHFDKSFGRVRFCALFAFAVMCLAALGLAVCWTVFAARGIEGAAPWSAGDTAFAVLQINNEDNQG